MLGFPAVADALRAVGGARVVGVAFEAVARLGRDAAGAFFTVSEETDALGRVAEVTEGALPDVVDQVGDATEARVGSFEFVGVCLAAEVAAGLVGAIDARRTVVVVAGGLVAGADVAGALAGGTDILARLSAGGAAFVGLVGVFAGGCLTEPAPNVPEPRT